MLGIFRKAKEKLAEEKLRQERYKERCRRGMVHPCTAGSEGYCELCGEDRMAPGPDLDF